MTDAQSCEIRKDTRHILACASFVGAGGSGMKIRDSISRRRLSTRIEKCFWNRLYLRGNSKREHVGSEVWNVRLVLALLTSVGIELFMKYLFFWRRSFAIWSQCLSASSIRNLIKVFSKASDFFENQSKHFISVQKRIINGQGCPKPTWKPVSIP